MFWDSNSQKNNPPDSVRKEYSQNLRTGAIWRDLPAEYGHWKNVRCRFCRWRDKGIKGNILIAFIEYASHL